MDLQKTGKFIAEMRKNKGLTQNDLGEALGLSSKAVSKWERGINAPDISVLTQLSKILEVSIAEILTGGEMKNELSSESADELTISSIGAYSNFFKRKYTKIIFILISIIILIFTLFSGIYFVTNYNKCFVYKLSSASDEFNLEGLIASNQKENSVIITGIRYYDKNKKIIDNQIYKLQINLYIDNVLIHRKNFGFKKSNEYNISNEISLALNENAKLSKYIVSERDLDKMSIQLIYESIDGFEKKIEIPLKIEKKFSNNKLFY